MDSEAQPLDEVRTNKSNRAAILFFLAIVFIVIAWIVVKPGVFTIQPIGMLPEGITFIYHSRNPDIPFFSSPDGLCIETQGSVTLMCRGTAISASTDLLDRSIIRLSYSHWAYLRSTGGLEFDK